jgi:hypothetical protein
MQSIVDKLLANPSKYSVAELRHGLEAGVIPAYVGIPLIQERMKQDAEMRAGAPQQKQPPIAQQVMQQASQQEQQPQPGLDQLQSNMPQSYAGGGIVAFAGADANNKSTNQLVPNALTQEEQDRAAMMETLRSMGAAGMDVATLPGRGIAGALESAVTRPARALGVPIPYLPESFYGGDASSMTPYMDQLRRQRGETDGAVPAAAPVAPPAGPPTTIVPPPPPPDIARPNTGIAGFNMPKNAPVGNMAQLARDEFKQYGLDAKSRADTLASAIKGNTVEGTPFSEMKASLEKEALEAGAQKDEARNMAIFKAGLAMMSGTSQSALQNIGAGAMAGAVDYQAANKDLLKAAKDRQKQLGFIEEAQRAEKRDDMKTRNAYLVKADDAADSHQRAAISALIQGTGMDQKTASDIYHTQMQAGATLGAAQIGATSRENVAEIRAMLAGAGGEKGGFTQEQLTKERQRIGESEEIAQYKKSIIDKFGKNSAAKPEFKQAVEDQIENILARQSRRTIGPLVSGAPTGIQFQNPEQAARLEKYFAPPNKG